MKHFLSIADLSPDEPHNLLGLALPLKQKWQYSGNRFLLQGKSVANDLMQRFSTVGTSIEVYEDPNKAVADADIIYTDVWTSMGQEEETAVRLKVFPPYQINQQMVNLI